MPKLKVYISSTFRDLEQYRSAVIREFEGAFSEGFALSRIMEYMYDNGHSVPFVKECEAEVAESDVYLLILGSRIGSYPPGSDKTYTEHEYEVALKENKRIFRFVSKHFNKLECDNVAEFRQFREQLNGLPVHEFTDLPSFENKFLRCLSYLVQSGAVSQRKFYVVLSVLVSLIGLVAAGISAYFLQGLPVVVIAGFVTLILLIFSCIVLFALKYILFPSSMSTLKKGHETA